MHPGSRINPSLWEISLIKGNLFLKTYLIKENLVLRRSSLVGKQLLTLKSLIFGIKKGHRYLHKLAAESENLFKYAWPFNGHRRLKLSLEQKINSLGRKSVNHLTPGGNKCSFTINQINSQKLQVSKVMHGLWLQTEIKGLNLNNPFQQKL